MLKGKVKMGTPATTLSRWYNDRLEDCSPEDRIWGWSIRATEALHYDRDHLGDECLRQMLYQGLKDTAEGAPAWSEKLSIKEGVRFLSAISTRIVQRVLKVDNKVILDASLPLMRS